MSHAAAYDAPDLSDRSIIGTGLSATARLALLVGFVCLAVAVAIGWRSEDPGHVAKVWLQNWLFGLAIALGGLFFVFIQHLTHAGWSVAVRRPAEALMSNLLWLWAGFIPFVVLHLQGRLSIVWPWFDMAAIRSADPAEAALVEAKAGYLNPQFFFIRAAAYFVVWAALAFFFWRNSVAQDSDGSVARSSRMERVAAPATLLFGLSITFASVDWIMGLSPAWFSTIFGVYFFAGCCAAGFSALALVCLRLQAAGYLKGVITAEHYQDIGKLIFAFGIVFWAYIAFSQYMLIWYANIPEENTWYLARQLGEWKWVSAALLLGHFCIPFLFLISRWTKRYKVGLTIGAIWMLAFAWLDLYYLVHPHIPHGLGKHENYAALAAAHADESAHFGDPLNWLMLAGVLGLISGFTLMRLREHPLVCRRDPRLDESLHFHNI
ncbi:MAG: quinol:cytochrome C oxidoreductase [Phycisphaerae bacterium]|nr:quinol:cytochrome C oxidoreductase [Phycisphaerae bacterium]